MPAYSQKPREPVGQPADSMIWRKHVMDSTRDARQIEMEAAKKARQKSLDSAKEARQQEIEAAKETRQSRMDSVATTRQHIMDSTRTVRQHIADSTKEIHERIANSIKLARQQKMDSMRDARQKNTAALNAIRKYKDSKHYKDSVERARTAKANLLKKKRQAFTDSVTTSRKRMIDSMTTARKVIIAAMHEKQKRRSDSLNSIKRYRESKRYADSVAIFKKVREQNIAKARKHFTDSVMTVRKHFTDSLTTRRKHNIDSLATLRSKRMDSLKVVRKKRADSSLAAKTKRENKIKADQKKAEDKKQLAIDMKIKQQREAWSNEKMLKKKWSLKRKAVQNTFTRYNYYFNANRKMEEALANMQRVKKENYDSLIELYPFDPNRDSSLLSSDMDSILHKISVGIQIHDPRTKWEDDMYLLMGEAQYYKGRYNDAATAFHYIISMDEQRKKKEGQKGQKNTKEPSIVETNKKTMLDFMKHKPVHNEAILWLARTFTESKQPEKSESVLSLLDADSTLPKSLTGRVALERAFLALNENNNKEASRQLAIAADDRNIPDWLRERSSFLNGQLLQQQKQYSASADAFQKVLDLNPKIDMDFYARKYMAFNIMYAGKGTDEATAALKKVLDDNKYATYHEQVYYVLGVLSTMNNDNETAIKYLQKGLHTQKTSRKQKAISFAALGNVYYNTGDYVSAKHAYDSSSKFASSASNDSLVRLAVSRSRVLDDVTEPAGVIHDQDSLLALSLLSNKEQHSIVRKYIRHLEEQKRDSAFRAENAGITSIAAAEPAEDAATTTWYFSNATMMQQGVTEFKRKWGNRPNTDNWRRATAQTFASTSSNTTTQTEGTENNTVDENGLPTEEYLLAAIPNTPEEQEKAYKLIQTGYADLADAYVNKLDDYDRALQTLDTLNKRFPSNDLQARSIYLRYIIALRKHEFDKARTYSRQLLDDYSSSEYAKKVKPSEDGAGMTNPGGITIGEFYDETYKLLMQRQYTDVIIRIQQAEKLYHDKKYKQRFMLIDAMALAASADYTQADTVLNNFFDSKPPDSLRAIGEVVKNYIAKLRPAPSAVVKPNANSTSNLKEMNKALTKGTEGPTSNNNTTNSKTDTSKVNPNTGQNIKPGYSFNPAAQHYCIISLPGLDSRALGIKAATGDFNTFKYSASNLIVNMDMLSPQQAILVIKSFNNMDAANSYLNSLATNDKIFHDYRPEEYHLMIISATNYIQLFVDHSITPYLAFYNLNYR